MPRVFLAIVAKITLIKSRAFLFLPLIFFNYCSQNYSSHGRVKFYNNGNKDTFSVSVTEEFVKLNPNSPPDKKNPKITEAEGKLIERFLKQEGHCLKNNKGSPLFIITNRQEKIYDITFAHLIEGSYNSKPLTPLIYFGRCIK